MRPARENSSRNSGTIMMWPPVRKNHCLIFAGSGSWLFYYVGVSLVPLIFITVFDYRATRKGIESEIRLRTARLVSNTRRSVNFFLEERRSAIEFISRLHPLEGFRIIPRRLRA